MAFWLSHSNTGTYFSGNSQQAHAPGGKSPIPLQDEWRQKRRPLHAGLQGSAVPAPAVCWVKGSFARAEQKGRTRGCASLSADLCRLSVHSGEEPTSTLSRKRGVRPSGGVLGGRLGPGPGESRPELMCPGEEAEPLVHT